MSGQPPSPTTGGAQPPVSRGPSRLLGAVVLTLGAVVMVGGIVYLYWSAKRWLPAPTPVAALPSPVLRPPAPPPPVGPSMAPPPGPPPRAALPFRSEPPSPDDARAPLPVTATSPVWGESAMALTLTVFADLECPHSVALLRAVLAEKRRRGDDLRLSFRHYPLSQHAFGQHAAEVLVALKNARGDAAFWRALAALLREPGPLDKSKLERALSSVGLEPTAAELAAPSVKQALDTDQLLAASLFVRETPTAFVNGVRLDGHPSKPALDEVLDRELGAAYLTLAAGVAPAALYRTRAEHNLVNLGEDPPVRACVPVGESARRGAAEPLVTVVEFTDFECELCRQGAEALRGALRAHPGELGAVLKHFPLPQHRLARYLANAALEARRVGGDKGFWAFADTLLQTGMKPDEAGLERAASRAGLDLDALLGPARDGAHDATVDADAALARKLGVTGAPTYFVNGRKVPGALSPAELETLLKGEIRLARRVRSLGSGAVSLLACGERGGSTAAPSAP